MNVFIKDGNETQVTFEQKKTFGEFLTHIREKFDSKVSIINSINVDGLEVGPEDEVLLKDIPLDHLNKVEVFTAQPREIAIETLQILDAFITGIEQRCNLVCALENPMDFDKGIMTLIDNLCVFSDSIHQIKTVLNRHSIMEIMVLEADLHSILVDLKQMQSLSQFDSMKVLIAGDLLKNLVDWRLSGVPAIIKSTDQ